MKKLIQPIALRLLCASALILSLTGPLAGCGGGDGGDGDGDGDMTGDGDGDGDGDTIDPALLAEYKRALPSLDILEARGPNAMSGMGMAVGDPAEAPGQVAPTVHGINNAIRGIVQGLEDITSHPPTLYNSETLEFLWGPFPDENSGIEGAHVLAYIRDMGDEADFRYHYALARGVGNDVANFRIVIWGGANPDEENEDFGAGVTLWDFEANRAFLDEVDPDHGPTAQGRFATVYAKGLGENDETVTWVVAAFRSFLPEEAEEGATPIDVDHLYGRVETLDENMDDLVIDFVNTRSAFNLFPEDDATTPETYDIALVAVNEGLGRAETTVSGGDLDTHPMSPGSSFTIVECWDAALARTYRGATLMTESGEVPAGEDEGAVEDCGPHLQNDLATLGIPSLDSIDQGLLAALDEVATNGVGE